MKQYIRYVLRPVENRYYTGKKIAIWQQLIRYSLAIVFCVAGMLISDVKVFGVILTVITALMLVDYFVFDVLSDKLLWKFAYKRFYGQDIAPRSNEFQTMKQFEQRPNAENYEKLQDMQGGRK